MAYEKVVQVEPDVGLLHSRKISTSVASVAAEDSGRTHLAQHDRALLEVLEDDPVVPP